MGLHFNSNLGGLALQTEAMGLNVGSSTLGTGGVRTSSGISPDTVTFNGVPVTFNGQNVTYGTV